jgi:phosphate-selective porin OprO and OprP
MRQKSSTIASAPSEPPSAITDDRRVCRSRAIVCLSVLSLAMAVARSAHAQATPTVEERLAAQEARIRELEARLQGAPPPSVSAPPAAAPSILAPPPPAPQPLYGFSYESGFFLGRPDTFQVRLRGLAQIDGRAYFDTGTTPIPDQFVLRRMRPILEGTFGNFVDFRIMPDFGGGQAIVQDALIDVRPWRWLALRAGKFKAPVGLERLQNDAQMPFLERGLPSNLVPDRDIGASLHGDVGGGILLYEVGIYNGGPDGSNNPDGDINDGKDGVFRVFSHPLRFLKKDAVKNLGVGFGASYGKQHGTAANTGLAPIRTAGQIAFFNYSTGVIAISDRYRLSPQLYYYIGPVGILAEYVRSSTTVTSDISTTYPRVTLTHQAFQVEASFVVTAGDKATYAGVHPKRPIARGTKGFGALDVAARFGALYTDPAAFPMFADETKSARSALEWAVQVNWYPTDYLRAGVFFARTTFDRGAAMGDRRPENALIGRLQVYF